MKIQGHKITVEKSYWLPNQVVTYSLYPWGSNDQYFQGSSEPIEVDLEDGLYLAESNLFDMLIYGNGTTGCTLQEAIDLGIATVQE